MTQYEPVLTPMPGMMTLSVAEVLTGWAEFSRDRKKHWRICSNETGVIITDSVFLFRDRPWGLAWTEKSISNSD